jgi:TRAP-type C4-dicarboxylate transport system substrate-binding protein
MVKAILNFVTAFFSFFISFMLLFSGSSFAYSKEKPMILKAAIDNPSTDIKAQTIKRLGDLITEKTNGRIKFEYFYGGSLIKKPAFVDAVARDIADISTGPASFVTGKIPELSPFNIYGAYDLTKYLDMANAIWPTLTALLAEKNIHPIMLQYSGNNIFCHRTKFLKTPADWKGQKMRTAGRWQSRLAEMWGASPLFMPPGDLYLALQRGTIDGFLLIFDIVYGLKLYEVAPYITDTALSNTIEIVTMNLDQWKALSKQDQAIFQSVAKEVQVWNYHETLKVVEHIKKDIVAKGGKIYELNKEEKSLYMKDVNTLEPDVAKVSRETGRKFIDILARFK